ncbi:MAG: FtsX-like permease family protein [Olegusella sp.]|nr:FtsX-like permease family protein [Olegusella sp.]
MAARPHMFRREVARSIRGSLGRFLAIMGIVALGCGFFAGLQMTGPDMREAADLWYDGTDLWDLRVISTLGFSDDDVARVRAVEGVEAAMPARSCDVMASAGDEQEAVRITSIDTAVAAASQVTGLYAVTSDDHDYLNRPMLREGRWPEAADECVVSADAVDGFAVGDTVEVLYGAEDLDGMLEVKSFTVVGTVSASDYPYTANFGSTTLGSGQIDDYLYVQDDAFVEDFPYTEIFVTVEGAIDEASESDAYQAVVNRVKSRLEDREGALASARRDDLEDEAQAELDQRRADYEVEKADAEAQLADAAAQLEGLRAALGAGGQEYQKGLAAYEQQRQEADEQFADAERELAEAQAEIDAIELPDLYLLDRTQSEGAATYHADADRIDRIADVFPALFFLVAALVALTTMTRMVEDDRIQIGTYKALGYGTATIASKYLAYAAIAGTVGAAAGTLVLTQVLPYIITNSYAIIYATPILPFPMPIDPATALASGGLGVGVTLLATWGAVVTSLRATPAELMLPRAPKAGKRILLERAGALWSRVSFSRKVTLRNLFRYKRRFAMTVIGIAGCTALLLVGFGLHDAIWDIIDRQFGPVIHYDTTVGLDESSTTEDVDEVVAYLEDAGATNIVRARQENMQAGSDNYSGSLRVAVLIPQDAAGFGDAVTFKDRVTQEHLHFGTDDVYLPEKTASLLGVGVGDSIRLYDQDAIGNAVGEGCALTVTGVVENYVGNLVYVGRDAWADVNEGDAVDASTTTTDASASDAIDASAAEPVFSTLFFARGDQVSKQALSRGLHDLRGVSTVTFTDETIDTYRTMLGVVNLIVVVLIVSAAALAFIVLYNLTNINIDERIREIASLRVLGFTRREVHTYVFREIALLAVIGDALGMVAGTYLARFVVVTAEVDYVMFGRVIHLTSYLYSFGLTLVFAALVLVMMRRKLDRVSMVESLKSVD